MAESQPSKLVMRVRFPSPALTGSRDRSTKRPPVPGKPTTNRSIVRFDLPSADSPGSGDPCPKHGCFTAVCTRRHPLTWRARDGGMGGHQTALWVGATAPLTVLEWPHSSRVDWATGPRRQRDQRVISWCHHDFLLAMALHRCENTGGRQNRALLNSKGVSLCRSDT